MSLGSLTCFSFILFVISRLSRVSHLMAQSYSPPVTAVWPEEAHCQSVRSQAAQERDGRILFAHLSIGHLAVKGSPRTDARCLAEARPWSLGNWFMARVFAENRK